LGPYEVLAPIGAGGMGEVYRARDTRLGREVAIKVLPSELSSDPDRLSRFEQEARSASALNHPNIVTIHDIGRADDVAYIAMELVEGKTLREVLLPGSLSTKQILRIGVQAAEGLAQAHSVGIVHRDLKPENLMIARDGLVKILDFGLAKLSMPESGVLSAAPTVARAQTQPGSVLGTVGYMSPEQASGQPVDFRSDQFSLGSILYEMAVGRKAFQRETAVDTLSAILHEDPAPIASINPQAPAPLRWIVERCLAKDPDERYASTRDLARELETVRDHLSEASVSGEMAVAIPRPRRSRPAVLLLLLVAIVAAALSGAFLLGKRAGKTPPPSFRRLTFRRGIIENARFAPDGQTILYDAAWEKNPLEIFSSRLDSPESRPLGLGAALFSVSLAGEMAVAVAPRRVPFGAVGTLARVSVAGGAPREILRDVSWADWSPDGKVLAIVREVSGKNRLEYPPGKLLFETSGQISDPRVSPSGDSVAFIEHPILGDTAGSVLLVDRSGRKRLLSAGWPDVGGLAWAPRGKEVWFTAARGGWARSLLAVTQEGRKREIEHAPGGIMLQDISREGKLLVDHQTSRASIIGRIAEESQERELSWLDYSFLRDLSGDGTTLLFDEEGEGGGAACSVYIRRTDGSAAIRLGEGVAQALSPDGKWALTMILSPSQLRLLPTGPGDAKDLTQPGFTYQYGARFLPDGRRVVFRASEAGKGVRYYVQDLERGKPHSFSPEGVAGSGGVMVVTPDGHFVSGVGADGRFVLLPVDGGPPRPFAGLEPGDVPLQLSPDGKTLYVRNGALPARLYRIETSSNKREFWRELMPSDPAGILRIRTIRITGDGASCFYGYTRHLSDLYLVEGVK
jgi:Tol biopolymer transport system component